MKTLGAALACGALGLFSLSAVAEDGGRDKGYAATGLVFDLPTGMSVARLDIHVSLSSVRLAYVFRSNQHQVVPLRFILPSMPVDADPDAVGTGAGAQAAGLVADTQPPNYLNLSVRVDGKPQALAGQGRAWLGDKNVTRQLLDAGVPLLYDIDGEAPWRRLPASAQAMLEAHGLLKADAAQWRFQATFGWSQPFAPGETRIEVGYTPMLDNWSDVTLNPFPEMEPGSVEAKAYCIDDAVRRAFRRKLGYEFTTVTHNLSLSQAWREPIARYRLVVDKSEAADLLAFCPLAARRISPTTFEWTASDFTPDQRIGVLFLTAPAPAPALAPRHIKQVPIGPLKAAYPDDWREAAYQAMFSPDKTLMALGVEDSAGYVRQVWLYQPATGRLVAASPHIHQGKVENPEDIAALDRWTWGSDGRFYLRAAQPFGQDRLFGADMNGFAEERNPPEDVAKRFAAYAAGRTTTEDAEATEGWRPPDFDDDSYNEQQGGAFIAWDQRKGHGGFELRAARKGDAAPRLIASGGWELEDFVLDPKGGRLFYNGENGLLVTDPDTLVTRRLQDTRGTPAEIRPINLSADGEILVYSASNACGRDAADETAPKPNDDGSRRVCLAYLPAYDRTAP